MARIPKELVAPFQVAGADALIYTVPAATKTVVRYIHISNPTGTARTLFLSKGADAAGNRIYDGFTIAAGTVRDDFCYHVMEAGGTLRAHADAGAALVLTINGDEIILG